MSPPSIVIAGAGLGGFEAFQTLKKLLKKHRLPHVITLINDVNYFTFVPMLHEVAAGSVEPGHVAVPLREQVMGTPHVFLQSRVQGIDLKSKTVKTDRGDIAYDYVIIALGSGVNFFNTPGAADYAETVRTLPEALSLHEKLIALLESARTTIQVSIIGGGYTGVELAGQLGDFSDHEVRRLYPGKELHVRIIEASPSLANNLPAPIQKLITERVKHLGIETLVNERVQAVNENTVTLGSGEALSSDLTIWSAGVGNRAADYLSDITMQKGCVMIDEFLRIKGMDNAYAIGDIAWGCNPGEDKPFPQLGEVAYHQGSFAAQHLIATLLKKPSVKPFMFKSKGTLMPVGDWYGIAKTGPFIWSGRIAWWLRRTIYVWYMPTLLRKLRIIIDWTLHSFGFRHTLNISHAEKQNKR